MNVHCTAAGEVLINWGQVGMALKMSFLGASSFDDLLPIKILMQHVIPIVHLLPYSIIKA